MRKTLLLAILLGAAWGFPAAAQITVRYVASVPGECKAATVNDENRLVDCRAGLVNVGYSNGRAMFLFNMGTTMAFAGDHDRQLTPKRYILYVSNLNIAGNRIDVTGTCTVEGQLKRKAAITCQAKTTSGPSFQAKIVYQASGPAELTPGE